MLDLEKSEEPLANTDSCQLICNGYIISGRLRARMLDSGKEQEYGPRDTFYITADYGEFVIENDTATTAETQVPALIRHLR